jgi:hypothetical protein
MKRLLQRIEDGRYYATLGTWTDSASQAYSFPDSAAAIRCCVEYRLPAVRLVLDSQAPPFHLAVPLFISQADDLTPASLNPPRPRNPMIRARAAGLIRDPRIRSQGNSLG